MKLRYQKRVLSSVLNVIDNKTLKKHVNDLVRYYKITLRKTCHMSVFELLTYQNAKTYAKHPSWRNIITILKKKKCILSVFDHVTYKNA